MLTFAFQPAPDDLLGPADQGQISTQGIDIGGVNEIDSALGGGVQHRMALRLIALDTEGHRPETELGDAQARAAQIGVVHGSTLPRTKRQRPSGTLALTAMRVT